jgi:aryl-alcohol dehydrogenase-like predicted oxidoreductase
MNTDEDNIVNTLENFTHTILGNTDLKVCRLGLSATYRPGKKAIYKALDAGINCFFGYGFDTQMTAVLRDILRKNREDYIVITGAYNLLVGHLNLRRTLEKRLRKLRTDYIDVFLYLGVMKPKQFTDQVREHFYRFRDEGKVKAVGMSCHDRKFAGKLAADGALDTLMIRYNAAHRGAEEDIFPHLKKHNPGLISYTATRWGYLLRRPKSWPEDGRIPTADMCYRFVLSNPNVHLCLMAPRNENELNQNVAALRQGPLSEYDMDFMRRFGDAVHHTKKWFM